MKIKLKNNTGYIEIKNIKLKQIKFNNKSNNQTGGKYGGEQKQVDSKVGEVDDQLYNMFNQLSKYD